MIYPLLIPPLPLELVRAPISQSECSPFQDASMVYSRHNNLNNDFLPSNSHKVSNPKLYDNVLFISNSNLSISLTNGTRQCTVHPKYIYTDKLSNNIKQFISALLASSILISHHQYLFDPK